MVGASQHFTRRLSNSNLKYFFNITVDHNIFRDQSQLSKDWKVNRTMSRHFNNKNLREISLQSSLYIHITLLTFDGISFLLGKYWIFTIFIRVTISTDMKGYSFYLPNKSLRIYFGRKETDTRPEDVSNDLTVIADLEIRPKIDKVRKKIRIDNVKTLSRTRKHKISICF